MKEKIKELIEGLSEKNTITVKEIEIGGREAILK